MLLLLKRDSLWIPVILLVLLVGCWSELDLYAPSFPQMMHHFDTTEQMMQWTLSLNFFGFFFASLLCGPLADAFGRRKIILGGSLIFVLGSFICLCAPNIGWMLFGRFIQGLGVSAPVSVAMAIVADVYQGERQIKLLSRMNSAITITMALAPIIGVYLTDSLGWQSNFWLIFALALLGTFLVWLFVPETLPVEVKQKFEARSLVSGYLTLLRSKKFLASAFGLCFSVAPYFVLIGILPLLFMEALGVSINEYAFYQGSIVGFFSALSLGFPYVLSRFNIARVVRLSSMLAFGALFLSLISSMVVPDNPKLITFYMLLYAAGIVVPPSTLFGGAMDMFPELRACVSSLIGAFRMLAMAIGTALAGIFYDGSFMPIAFIMFVSIAVALPMSWFVMKKRATSTSSNEAFAVIH